MDGSREQKDFYRRPSAFAPPLGPPTLDLCEAQWWCPRALAAHGVVRVTGRCRRQAIPRDASDASMSSANAARAIGYVVAGLLCLATGATASPTRLPRGSVRHDALARLSEVFEIDEVPLRNQRRTPPQYMSELYRKVAYSDGISKKATPFNADTVRSFPDRDASRQMHFYFNVSNVKTTERILGAEFHIFKLRSRSATSESSRSRNVHLVDLRLYEVLEEGEFSADRLLLLEQQRVSCYRHGWHVFNVTDTVERWLNDSQLNLGFFLTATSLGGQHVNGSHVRFAQRAEHHYSKQPGVVLFTDRKLLNIVPDDVDWDVTDDDDDDDDNSRDEETPIRHRNYVRFLNEQHRADHGAMPVPRRRRNRHFMSARAHRALVAQQRASAASATAAPPAQSGRTRRAAGRQQGARRRRQSCSRHDLYVDFDRIGWAGWIISPGGYNAYHCKGGCPFPLDQNLQPTNHATVQSIVHALNISKDLRTPCCVPDKLFSISLLYFEDDDNVILKQYDEMVAESCGCH